MMLGAMRRCGSAAIMATHRSSNSIVRTALPSSSSSSSSRLFFSTDDTMGRRRLDVAIVGAPNAGKSQLLNCLTGANVAAVSRKRHTTRQSVLGVRTVEEAATQLVFVDTPGYLRLQTAKQERLMRSLVVSAAEELERCDYTLLVIDAAKRLDEDLREAVIFLMLRAMDGKNQGDDHRNFAVVLNKVDLIHPKTKLLEIAHVVGSLALACCRTVDDDPSIISKAAAVDVSHNGNDNHSDNGDTLAQQHEQYADQFPEIFYTSALMDDGVDDILKHLVKIAPEEEWLCDDPHEATPQTSPVERVEEIIREKVYRCVHREVPHAVTQVNRLFKVLTPENTTNASKNTTNGDGRRIVRIEQDLLVKTESHRRILRGKNDVTLSRITEQAKRDIETMLQCPVILHLHVKKSSSQYDPNSEPFIVDNSGSSKIIKGRSN